MKFLGQYFGAYRGTVWTRWKILVFGNAGILLFGRETAAILTERQSWSTLNANNCCGELVKVSGTDFGANWRQCNKFRSISIFLANVAKTFQRLSADMLSRFLFLEGKYK